jgi:hypothetical protein
MEVTQMKRMLSFFALCLLLCAATSAYGDIARPKPSPQAAPEGKVILYTGLEVIPQDGFRAKLQISQQTLNELRDAMKADTTSQSLTQRVTQSSTKTIVAGLFLFMSISFAGVWLMRSPHLPSRGSKAAVAVLISIATLGAAVVITRANAGPPPSYYWRNLTKNLSAGKPTSGGIEVEVVPDGTGMKLIIPLKRSNNSDD